MKRKIGITFCILGVLVLWGCFPDGPDYVEELDVVLINYNKDYDFAAKATYSIPDEIVIITGNQIEGEDPEFIPDPYASQMLAKIESNMADLGWEKVDVSESPDLLLLPVAWTITTITYYYDYWSWWYGGYYPYWPYYPPVYVTSYTTGTLEITLKDPEILDGTGVPTRQWTAAVNGLLTGEYSAERATDGIDKAFNASPYLKTN
jgi:hypothetical protein